MEERSAEQLAYRMEEARDGVNRAIELLSREDIFGAVLQLQKARSLLGSLVERLPRAARHVQHDWGVLDPYTVQCRRCGEKRPMRTEERTLMPLAFQ